MTACKQYQRELALLSVQALNEKDKAAALGHLELCADCRAYWDRLQTVVGLCQQDAERSIVPTGGPIALRPRRPQDLFTWPRAAALAASVAVLAAGIFLSRQEPRRANQAIPVISQSDTASPLSIADSRRLLNKDLDALTETPRPYQPREFVFSVATRHEGP